MTYEPSYQAMQLETFMWLYLTAEWKFYKWMDAAVRESHAKEREHE